MLAVYSLRYISSDLCQNSFVNSVSFVLDFIHLTVRTMKEHVKTLSASRCWGQDCFRQ